jgi:uncharacterized protein YndB with AHSA1/START domain
MSDQALDTAADAAGVTTSSTTEQVYVVFIKASPEAVFEAITTPEFTRRYFYGAGISISADAYRSQGPDGSDWGSGATFEFDPPRRVVHEWRSGYDPDLGAEPPSRVTWEITPGDDGTCMLTVTHDRLGESPKTAASVAGPGWMRVLSGLKTLLETGKPLA